MTLKHLKKLGYASLGKPQKPVSQLAKYFFGSCVKHHWAVTVIGGADPLMLRDAWRMSIQERFPI